MKKRYISWGEIDNILCDLVSDIKECMHPYPDRVIGVANGGTIPAAIIARALGVPLELVHYSSKTGNADGKNHSNKVRHFDDTERLLVVDDLSDSGNTLRELYDVTPWGTHFLVMFHKKTASKTFQPDFVGEEISPLMDDVWLVFPWECEYDNKVD